MIFEWSWNSATKEWGINYNTTWVTKNDFIKYIEKEYDRRTKLTIYGG